MLFYQIGSTCCCWPPNFMSMQMGFPLGPTFTLYCAIVFGLFHLTIQGDSGGSFVRSVVFGTRFRLQFQSVSLTHSPISQWWTIAKTGVSLGPFSPFLSVSLSMFNHCNRICRLQSPFSFRMCLVINWIPYSHFSVHINLTWLDFMYTPSYSRRRRWRNALIPGNCVLSIFLSDFGPIVWCRYIRLMQDHELICQMCLCV